MDTVIAHYSFRHVAVGLLIGSSVYAAQAERDIDLFL